MRNGTTKHHKASPDHDALSPEFVSPDAVRPRHRVVPILITLATVAIAAVLGWTIWLMYFQAPWTRDGTVRAYVVTIAPEVSGRVVELPVADNQFVHRGDLLLVIDPTNYKIDLSRSEAAVQQAQINAQKIAEEGRRRQRLVTESAVSLEEAQVYHSDALAAQARYQQALAALDQARVNLERTQIRSPVNGWVTNLLVQRDDFASVGQNELSLVDADSFWVDGYFEETKLHAIHVGDPAKIKLMGYRQLVRGHVGSIARGINVANAQPNQQGVATVNPIFTWVRLAQRIPVRIEIDGLPEGVVLVAGMTATVQIDSQARSRAK
ncbi:MAG TPA: efflux transporter periplasmic adaptor subunit [Deltaproteobacteria bacterium]|jgi:RND family efflux transporter MFP subunit|nr:efflux transporter periplasmic adaptor subunit [Deltaproteobacteria bacterium]